MSYIHSTRCGGQLFSSLHVDSTFNKVDFVGMKVSGVFHWLNLRKHFTVQAELMCFFFIPDILLSMCIYK